MALQRAFIIHVFGLPRRVLKGKRCWSSLFSILLLIVQCFQIFKQVNVTAHQDKAKDFKTFCYRRSCLVLAKSEKRKGAIKTVFKSGKRWFSLQNFENSIGWSMILQVSNVKLKERQKKLCFAYPRKSKKWKGKNYHHAYEAKMRNSRGKKILEQISKPRFFTEFVNTALFSLHTAVWRKTRDFRTP